MSDDSKQWGIVDLLIISACVVTFLLVWFVLLFCLSSLSVIRIASYVGAVFLDIFLLFVISKLCKKKGLSWRQFGFQKGHRLRAFVFGCTAGLLLPTIVSIARFKIPAILDNVKSSHLGYMLIFPATLEGFTGIFLTPFTEEIFARGILYRVIRRRFGPLGSIFLVSSIVSLLHVSSVQNLEYFVIRFFYNVVMSWMYERSGNMYQCVSCHMAINYISAFSRVVSV